MKEALGMTTKDVHGTSAAIGGCANNGPKHGPP